MQNFYDTLFSASGNLKSVRKVSRINLRQMVFFKSNLAWDDWADAGQENPA